jgi:hypothetical protein
MKILFALWGFLGFFVCGAATLAYTTPLTVVPCILLLWIGGMVMLASAFLIDKMQ